jgi:putative ABC transport system permease protein
VLKSYASAAFRNLTRNWLYAAVTIGGLAIGFAAAILIGLFVRDEFSYDRWIPGHERLFQVFQTLTPPGGGEPLDEGGTRGDVAAALKLDFPQIEAIARMVREQPILKRGQVEAVEPDFYWADPNLLDLLRLPVVAGDIGGALQSPDGIVLTRTLARRYFGRDAPLGGILLVNPAAGPPAPAALNQPHPMRVMAVIQDLPSNTHLKVAAIASGLAVFSPLAGMDQGHANPMEGSVYTYARLQPGASAEALRADLPAFVARRIPSGPLMGSSLALHLAPLASIHLAAHLNEVQWVMKPGGDRKLIVAVTIVGVMIVLVGGINFVTLVTARSARRAVEVGVRKASGAGRRDLVIQFIGEAVLQVALAMLAATALAELTLPALNSALQRTIQFDYLHDPTLTLALLAATLVLGVAAGAYPALVLSSFRPATALKGGPNQAGGSRTVRQILVVLQFAVLIGLILATVTLYRQTTFALRARLQVDSDHTLWINEPCNSGFIARVRSVPGVRTAVCSSSIPLENGGAPTAAFGQRGRTESIQMAPADFGFLDFYGLKPLAGRFLDAKRGEDARLLQPGVQGNPSVVLNQAAVRRLGFASPEVAVGRTVSWRRLVMAPDAPPVLLPPEPSTVVGVAPDFSLGSVRSAVEPMIFYVDPSLLFTANVRLTGRDIPHTLRALDRLWKTMGQPRPMRRKFVEQAMEDLYRDIIAEETVMAICAGLAVFIACLGLFALAAFTAEQRTKEIGVRKAMGASTIDILRLLIWQFTQPVLWANLIAWPLAWWAMDHWLHGFAYRVDLPPWLFLAATALALLIAWATVSVHAWLVARAKPVTALRYE